MSRVRLGWAKAEVKDAKLTVALDGEVPDGWTESFERTVRLLGDGEWGEVKINEDRVQVSDVTPGSEDKLRHHLESVVAQANAAHEARERDAESGGSEGEAGRRSGADAEMTGRFRSFAENREESEKEGSDGDS